MASTALTVRNPFSLGMLGGGKQDSTPAGTILGALGKIQGTLNTLVGLTQEGLNIDKKDQIVDQREQRDLSLKGAEADPADIKPQDEGGPGILGKLKGAFGSLGKKAGPKTWFLIVAAGLALLNKYSAQLVQPLANLLEWFDTNGIAGVKKLWEKVKLWTYNEWEEHTKEIGEFFDKWKKDGEYRQNWNKMIESVKAWNESMKAFYKKWEEPDIVAGKAMPGKGEYRVIMDRWLFAIGSVFRVFKAQYLKIQAWIKSYDEDKSGKLEPKEIEKMAGDLRTIAVEQVEKFFGELFYGIGDMLQQAIFISAGVGMAWKVLAPKLLGTGAVWGPMKGVGMSKWSLGSVGIAGGIAIGFMIANAYVQINKGIQIAMEQAVMADGGIDYAKFAGGFFGGDEAGGWRNAFATSTRLGGSFAAVGMGIGMIGGFPGMLLGGVLGYIFGSLVGIVTGKMGSDKMTKMFEKFGLMVTDTVDVIGNFFTDLIVGIKAAARFENPFKAIAAGRAADPERLAGDIDRWTREKKGIDKYIHELQVSKASGGLGFGYHDNVLGIKKPNKMQAILDKEKKKSSKLQEQLDEANELMLTAPTLSDLNALEEMKNNKAVAIVLKNQAEAKLAAGDLDDAEKAALVDVIKTATIEIDAIDKVSKEKRVNVMPNIYDSAVMDHRNTMFLKENEKIINKLSSVYWGHIKDERSPGHKPIILADGSTKTMFNDNGDEINMWSWAATTNDPTVLGLASTRGRIYGYHQFL